MSPRNWNRIPDYVQGDGEEWECELCGRHVPKGCAPHVRIRGFGDCITLRVYYAIGPEGTPARGSDGLPVVSKVELGWA